MNNVFVGVGQELAQKFTENTTGNKNSYVYRVTPTVTSVNIKTDKLSGQLKKINPKKASGPGSGTAKEFSILRDDVIDGLEIVYNKSRQSNIYPDMWKLARVKTVHKKGKKDEVTNYRPLSILSIPGKLLQGQICDTIDNQINENRLISEKQWGFRKGRSTEGLLLKLTETWKAEIDKGFTIGVVFIDFQKAFDTVSHDVLSYKLQACGISGDLHKLILNYLSGRKQYTEVNNQKSSTKPVNCGVPQGSLLGPRLYTIQVNDLPESTSEGELSLFANDTNVYCIGTDIEEVIDTLNRIMAEVYDWCVKNKLTVHPGKSEAMILRRIPFIGPLRPLMYGGNLIKFVTVANCLGIVIDHKLSWNLQIKKVCKSFSKKLGALKRMGYLPRKVLEEVYFKTVISSMVYGISVWGSCSVALFQQLEAVHARAARFIYKISKTTTDENCLRTAGWQPLSYIYKRRLLTLMHQAYYNKPNWMTENMCEKKDKRLRSSRSEIQLDVKMFKTELGRNSLKYRGPSLWNAIPDRLKKIESSNSFKKSLKSALKIINNVSFNKGTVAITHKLEDFSYY